MRLCLVLCYLLRRIRSNLHVMPLRAAPSCSYVIKFYPKHTFLCKWNLLRRHGTTKHSMRMYLIFWKLLHRYRAKKILNAQVFGTLLPASQDWKHFTCHATLRSSVMFIRHKGLSETHIFVQMELTTQVYAGPILVF